METDNDKTSESFGFRQEIISSLLQRRFQYQTKLRDDGLKAVTEYLRIITKEAIERAVEEAHKDSCDAVQLRHIEKVVPEWLLDH
ncbi:hypothetical protein Gasu2_25350 [Galdieria sulphuraria]|uniref:Centromere protein X n=1 Tax=Galdieria sulphuraria TaxID=130081 RepID=M2Y4F9_GALSU|nr:uncharacterized protein Gasu_18440 [Galdieria sulphuraria]EME30828.1 hypothetical protein Gasu_18440 [Galdieria sulphuraria]GJD08232.1 hypothetical protein Gasu2_25350 [Galdieria sulphuraria]|eukprot:XP_005707348.1 hypothetical protein Gasu_18440 [Galdieria sulphuraria]